MTPRAAALGFTLVEMLLSVALIGLLVGISLPLYTTFVGRNDLDITAQQTASAIRRAQSFSRGVNADSQWGVHIASGNVVLFKGSTYAARDTAYDEVTPIPGSITPSGLDGVVFTRLTAIPNTTGTIVFTSNTNSSRTVTINAKGMVAY